MAVLRGYCAARVTQAEESRGLSSPGVHLSPNPEIIDLSANENPLGPSPRVLAAIIEAAKQAHRYPEKDGPTLKNALASRFGITTDEIVLGNGSAELIDAIARTTLGIGDQAIVGNPSFPAYRSSIARTGADIIAVPLIDGAEDLTSIAKQVSDRTRLVILANPNNPTGGTFAAAKWEEFICRIPWHVVVVVDEAYSEYVTCSDYPNALEQVAAGENVVVLRSFSKAYGLAGLRIGYGIAPAPLRQRIEKQIQHFNTSRVAQAAALAALSDQDYLAHCVEMNANGRHDLHRELTAMGYTVAHSQANFLLVPMPNAVEVHKRLRQHGVLVKLLDAFGQPEAIRVTVGRPEENRRFLEALAHVMTPDRDLQAQ